MVVGDVLLTVVRIDRKVAAFGGFFFFGLPLAAAFWAQAAAAQAAWAQAQAGGQSQLPPPLAFFFARAKGLAIRNTEATAIRQSISATTRTLRLFMSALHQLRKTVFIEMVSFFFPKLARLPSGASSVEGLLNRSGSTEHIPSQRIEKATFLAHIFHGCWGSRSDVGRQTQYHCDTVAGDITRRDFNTLQARDRTRENVKGIDGGGILDGAHEPAPP